MPLEKAIGPISTEAFSDNIPSPNLYSDSRSHRKFSKEEWIAKEVPTLNYDGNKAVEEKEEEEEEDERKGRRRRKKGEHNAKNQFGPKILK